MHGDVLFNIKHSVFYFVALKFARLADNHILTEYGLVYKRPDRVPSLCLEQNHKEHCQIFIITRCKIALRITLYEQL